MGMEKEWRDETSEIYPVPVYVAGAERTMYLLNDREATGIWDFWSIPVPGIPAIDAEEQDYDFGGLEDDKWRTVAVPGELEMQGFELENNTEYYYRRKISVPRDFDGLKCLLKFDGVYSNARVWIDNHYVCSHSGGFTTWYCDITDWAKPGEESCLVVGIADLEGDHPGLYNQGERRPVGTPAWASYYAHHNVGGILRDVALVGLHASHLCSLHTEVEFDDAFVDAWLKLDIRVDSPQKETEVIYTLFDAEETACTENRIILTDDSAGSRNSGKREAVTSMYVKAPRHWDAEHPYLYTLQTQLFADGQMTAMYQEKIGFREISFAGKKGSDPNKVYVNGREVKLRGTCRHDVSFRFGRSTSAQEDWEEVRAYKAANINHVRTSHYPASEYFLRACDELGMYVEQENAACFQGANGFGIFSKPEDFLGGCMEMVERDRNHPCILIWSLGNESGFEETEGYRMEYDYIRAADQSRPIIFSYPATGRSLPLPYDIFSMHYVDVMAPMGMADMPVLHDEYMHISCYNLDELSRDPNVRNYWGKSIKKAWDRIFETDGALGGDLWGGIDDVFYLPGHVREKWQSHSRGAAVGYGPWGSVLDVHRRLKPEAYLTKKAYTPVLVDEKNVILQDRRVWIPVKNRFDHTNLRELTVAYQVGESAETLLQIGEDIPPHKSGILRIEDNRLDGVHPLKLSFYKGDSLIDEYLVWSGKDEKICKKETFGEVCVQEDTSTFTIHAGGSTFVFDKESAQLTKGEYKERTLLTGGPQLVLTGVDLGKWKKKVMDVSVSSGGRAVVTLGGEYEQGLTVCFTITIARDGEFITRYLVQSGDQQGKVVQELGIRYGLAEDVDRICWQREGLYSVYPPDHIGRNQGTAYRRCSQMTEEVSQRAWKDDMRDDFLYEKESPENGLVTRDFRAMRENIRNFEARFAGGNFYVQVTDKNAINAARISVSADGGDAGLLILNRWRYPDLGWGNADETPVCIGSGTYGDAVMRMGCNE